MDLLFEGESALGSLFEYHEGDADMTALLYEVNKALLHARNLQQCIKDMDKWIKENEGVRVKEYVAFDKAINNTESYLIYKELTDEPIPNDARS